MQAVNGKVRSCALIEALEGRRLMAAEQYQLLDLLGYSNLDSSWNYSNTGTAASAGQTRSLTGTAKIAVGAKTAVTDGHASDIVKFSGASGSGTSLKTAWYSTTQGVFIGQVVVSTPFGAITINLHDTRIGPQNMVVGKSYKDTGTFSGSFSSTALGQTITGTYSGTDNASSSLSKHQTVTVQAGTFDAIKGSYSINISGTVHLKIGGLQVNAPFSLVDKQSFFATPDVGVVKLVQHADLGVDIPFSSTLHITADATSKLKSFLLANT